MVLDRLFTAEPFGSVLIQMHFHLIVLFSRDQGSGLFHIFCVLLHMSEMNIKAEKEECRLSPALSLAALVPRQSSHTQSQKDC